MAVIAQHTKDRDIIINWKDQDGNVVPLTDVASISGILRLGREPDNTDVEIDGVLAVHDENNGQHKWTISATDSANSGHFTVFFYITFDDDSVMPSLGTELDIIPTSAIPT